MEVDEDHGSRVSPSHMDILPIRHGWPALAGQTLEKSDRKSWRISIVWFRFHCLQQDILSPFVIQSDSEESPTQVTPS